jgi:hypothetical protein
MASPCGLGVGGVVAESANHCEKEIEMMNKTDFTNSISFLHHFSIIVCYTEERIGRSRNDAGIYQHYKTRR